MTTKIPVELSSTPSIVDNGDATAITIDSSEVVSISNSLTFTPNTFTFANNKIATYSNNFMYIYGGSAGIIIGDNISGNSNRLIIRDTHTMEFETNGSERMRIDSSGNLLIGKTADTFSAVGGRISASGVMTLTADGNELMNLNRLTNDGALVYFSQNSTIEGNISVSGTTVSYNGFTGTHESSGIAVDTAIGTVCSTIDELDTYVSGNKEGQTRTDHAKIKVSDTEGDSRVYGILSSYSEIDNKPIVASVGIGSVLVTGACAGGDLLESNGDGTAKVQDDDIIRSKTIGKVTIGNSDTNVKLVSCVLYCG